ncbi:MAG TPA: GNAT family N-acetyltransferase [Chloroflexia bacterium]|nr:GNAT family N-acetyltransferase [Chloroflexia bacterium]
MNRPPADENAGLPRSLGDGLTLRWATPDDIEAVADYNVRHLSDHVTDNPPVPNEGVRDWTRDLMRGRHPTTRASDFTVVVDEQAGGRIVSCLCLISQTWAYAGIPFGVGRPELVSTSPAYRRRGLVRAQMDAIHARSAARGELVQAITGIAWYYRQFGYELTMAHGGSRRWLPFRIPAAAPDSVPAYRLRPATDTDFALIDRLYAAHGSHQLVTRVRSEAEWRYELPWKKYWLVEDAAGAPVGYAQGRPADGGDEPELVKTFVVDELAVLPGRALRPVALFLGQAFLAQLVEANQTRTEPLTTLALNLGPAHPVYAALGDVLEAYRPAWVWFLRVPDLPAFLRHIAPVLEARLAASVMAGHTGALRLDFYRAQVQLTFSGGRLTDVSPYVPARMFDGDAHFPDLTFLHLLFGYRTLAEVNHIYPDCYADPEASVLLGILFPPQPSNPIHLD